ncbi:jg25610 [Pararge aegeria aegeria]|uniref:Jg25610 protein n=1 Tax=Pararge aegeria aegeria TaxID=348720 RepID=A0A8S4RAI3_9NEOP|nr:jg25610 [Pararge aegeria aegeria]
MVRRNFLKHVERRSRARLNWPLLSLSTNRSRDGSERAVTSPTGRWAIVAGPSDTLKLSKHIGPPGNSSLAEDRTRARVVANCRQIVRHPAPPLEQGPR